MFGIFILPLIIHITQHIIIIFIIIIAIIIAEQE